MRPGPAFPDPSSPRRRTPRSAPDCGDAAWAAGGRTWTLTAIVTYTTENTTLLPTLLLLGSFLTPVAFTLWAYERHGRDLGVQVILGCLLAGGTLGVLGASVAENHLLHPSLSRCVGVGLVEEAAN